MDVRMPINQTVEWKKLQRLTSTRPNLKEMFAKAPNRINAFSVKTPHMYYDFSRQLINGEISQGLIDLARAAGLREKIGAMFSGEKINTTENRAVLHIALRNLQNTPILVDGKDVMPEVNAVLDKMMSFSEEVHNGVRLGVTGKAIKNIVSVGIGGSYLGPEYLAEACRPYAKEGMKLAFVANVDGTDFLQKTAGMDPEETMFVIVSKTFTTAETIKNAKTARDWMLQRLAGKGKAADIVKKHFVAVSTAEEKVVEFGIDKDNMFGFWDWVGGRYSATSAVGGVPLSLYLGFENFHKILEGANWMDGHFLTAPIAQNIPATSGLLDVLNINFYGLKTRALLPYSQSMSRLPAHTQQVEMESNGKRVDIYRQPVEFTTGEVVFGEPGTNGQHSFYQEIHQGQVIPCDFIGFTRLHPSLMVGTDSKDDVGHHKELMTNFLAQADALAFGKEDSDPAKFFPGNRPTSSLLLKTLDPFTAGILLAWTEHRAATKGFIWDINSFDQFGVELGKKLGVNARKAMLGDQAVVAQLNPSTRVLFDSIMSGELPS